MRVLIDGRPLQGPSSVRGIGTYTRGLLQGLARQPDPPTVRLLLAAGGPAPREPHAGVASQRIPTLHPTLQPLADPLLVSRAVRRLHPDVFHGVEYAQPAFGGAPVVMTVHDLIPFRFPNWYPWVRRSHLPALRMLRFADHVIAVSAATANDVQRLAHVLPSRITVVPEGINESFAPSDDTAIATVLQRFGIRQPYVLAVGTFDPRKRIDVLADVARRIRKNIDAQLVIAGDQGTFSAVVVDALRASGVDRAARVTGHVTQTELAALYSGAACLLFTSAYEGFGLPPLESMACGTPAVVFDNSSLPEVAGDAAVMVRDGDGAAMADAALLLLHDDAERQRRATLGSEWVRRFDWTAAAARTLAVYHSVLR
jgi:glycosyltransferase involved in cell wall biosynthesis